MLQDLKKSVTPTLKEGLKDIKEMVAENWHAAMEFIKNFNVFSMFEGGKEGGKGLQETIAGFFAWFLSPETKKENQSAESASKIPEKPKEKSPEEAAQEAREFIEKIEKEAEKVQRLVIEYRATQDPAAIRRYFLEATTRHESESFTKVERQWVINTAAAHYHRGELRRNSVPEATLQILEKPGRKSNELFPKGAENVEQFRERLMAFFECDATQAGQILKYCAVGPHQIVPAWHFEKIGLNPDNLEDIYHFLSTRENQDVLQGEIADELGKRWDWNPMYMATDYYAGSGNAKALQKFIKEGKWNANLAKPQPGGHESILSYMGRTMELMNKLAS